MPFDKKAWQREYYERKKNDPHYREMNRKSHSDWVDRNPDKMKTSRVTWYLKHRNEYNAGRIDTRQIYREMLFDILGGAKCVRCGFSDKRALQFDHKQGGGNSKINNEERKDHHRYLKYIKAPELARKTFQVLCANCNSIKRHEKYKSPLFQVMSK